MEGPRTEEMVYVVSSNLMCKCCTWALLLRMKSLIHQFDGVFCFLQPSQPGPAEYDNE